MMWILSGMLVAMTSSAIYGLLHHPAAADDIVKIPHEKQLLDQVKDKGGVKVDDTAVTANTGLKQQQQRGALLPNQEPEERVMGLVVAGVSGYHLYKHKKAKKAQAIGEQQGYHYARDDHYAGNNRGRRDHGRNTRGASRRVQLPRHSAREGRRSTRHPPTSSRGHARRPEASYRRHSRREGQGTYNDHRHRQEQHGSKYTVEDHRSGPGYDEHYEDSRSHSAEPERLRREPSRYWDHPDSRQDGHRSDERSDEWQTEEYSREQHPYDDRGYDNHHRP